MVLSYTTIVLIVWRKNEYIGKIRKKTLGMRTGGKRKRGEEKGRRMQGSAGRL
jgi:hypothetical protein